MPTTNSLEIAVSRSYKKFPEMSSAIAAAEALQVPYLVEKYFVKDKRAQTVLVARWRIDIFCEPEDERGMLHYDK